MKIKSACIIAAFACLCSMLMQPAEAQQAQEPPAARLQSGAVTSGVGYLRAGRWGQLRATVHNPSDHALDLIVASTLGTHKNIQFGRRIWLPAKSQMVVDYPVLVDGTLGVEPLKGLLHETLLLVPAASGEGERAWLAKELGQSVTTEERTRSIAVLGQSSDATLDLLTNIRQAKVEERGGVRSIREDVAPRYAQAWETLDGVTIGSTPQLDTTQMAALRTWLMQGGVLWIQLDKTDEQFAAALLGDAWDVAVVDDVTLAHVALDGGKKNAADNYDIPVKFVRTLPGGWQVHHTVDQWPLVMSRPLGKGTVLLTTLDADTFSTAGMEDVRTVLMDSFFPRLSFHTAENDNNWATAATAMTASHIDRPIVSRAVVLVVLLLMIVAMVVVGVVFDRMGRLELMGGVSLLLAAVVALALIGIGRANQGQVPLTLASVRFVQVVPEVGQAVVSGTAAVYSPATLDKPLVATQGGGLLWPDMNGLQGKTVRLLMTGQDEWMWQGVEFSSGVIRASHFSNRLDIQPLGQWHASASFGPDGLKVHARHDGTPTLTEPLLAGPDGVMGVRVAAAPSDADGQAVEHQKQYVAGAGEMLRAGEFVLATGAMLTDRQQQMQHFYSSLFRYQEQDPLRGQTRKSRYLIHLPSKLMLIGWTQAFPLGMELQDTQAAMHDASLAMLPVAIEKTPAGTAVFVPGPFNRFEVPRNVGRESRAHVFDETRRQWLDNMADAQRFLVAFVLPPAVLPLNVERATLTVNISAPGWAFEVHEPGARADAPPLARIVDPAGEVKIELKSGTGLKADADGSLKLVFRIVRSNEKELEDPSAVHSTWTIHALPLLDVHGKVQGD